MYTFHVRTDNRYYNHVSISYGNHVGMKPHGHMHISFSFVRYWPNITQNITLGTEPLAQIILGHALRGAIFPQSGCSCQACVLAQIILGFSPQSGCDCQNVSWRAGPDYLGFSPQSGCDCHSPFLCILISDTRAKYLSFLSLVYCMQSS